MDDLTMNSRLSPISEVVTPTGRYRNQVIDVGGNSVTVVSEATGNKREVSFQEIRAGSTKNGCIIASFRQILGLD